MLWVLLFACVSVHFFFGLSDYVHVNSKSNEQIILTFLFIYTLAK